MFKIEREEDGRRIGEFPALSSMTRRWPDRPWFAKLACVLTIALLAGCAASGPVSVGPETYLMANTGAWSWSSGAVMESDLFQQANDFCKAEGRHLMPVNVASTDASFTRFAHAQLLFRCLRTGNPELRPPNLVLLCHKTILRVSRWQHGQRGRVLAMARAIATRTDVIEVGI